MAVGDKGNAALATARTTTGVLAAVTLGNGKIRPVATIQLVNEATATVGATVNIEGSVDGTTYSVASTRTLPIAAATYTWVVNLADSFTHVRINYTQQTGGTSTLDAQLGWTTTA